MKPRALKLISAALILGIALSAPAAALYGEPARVISGASARVGEKDETIYAKLNPSGSVYAAYVVNRLNIEEPGSVMDYGAYSTLINLTDTGELKKQGSEITFTAGQGNFYYQGNMENAALPWNFEIQYFLNGVETAPEALAGKSGELEIKLSVSKNEDADPVFYENYMLQFTLMFEHEKCSNIIAPDAVLASAGKSAAIAYTVLPKKDASFSIKATVEDFEFDGIDITAMPFSMNFELPDTDDMVSDFRELTDAIAELNGGVGDLKSGVSTLKSGANELESGSLDIASGLRELGINSWTLLDSSAKIKNALWQVSSSLKSGLADMPDLSGLGELPAGLIELAGGLNEIADGLDALKGGFSQAYAALGSAIDDMPSASVTPEDIGALLSLVQQGDTSLLPALGALASTYEKAQIAKGTYAQVKDAFDAVAPTLTDMSGGIRQAAGTLSAIAGEISGSLSKLSMLAKLQELSAGLLELSANYGKFHDGLGQYFSGVGELSQGYGEFHSGIHEFAGGVGKLYSGVRDLRKGTNELEDETSDMPEKVQQEIDDKLKEYTGSEFERVSFTSKQNTNIGVVQFVIKSDAIKKPEEAKAGESAPKEQTVWERVGALFSKSGV